MLVDPMVDSFLNYYFEQFDSWCGVRADILPVGPGFATRFKRTTPAVRRCKNEQQRCSYGRDRVGARRYPLFAAVACTTFTFYLLCCVVHGCLKFGTRFFLVKIHPMKRNGTYLNSFLFNVCLFVICSFPVATFATDAFAGYARYTGTRAESTTSFLAFPHFCKNQPKRRSSLRRTRSTGSSPRRTSIAGTRTRRLDFASSSASRSSGSSTRRAGSSRGGRAEKSSPRGRAGPFARNILSKPGSRREPIQA